MKHVFIFLAFVLVLSLIAISQVPNKISYQGLLTTSAGTPVEDGSYTLKFDIFNLPSGGSSLWNETFIGVSVNRGVFNVIFGTTNPMLIPFNDSMYVEVMALGGPGISSPLTFSPRTELTSSPYSLQSRSLLGRDCAATGTEAIAGGRYNFARGAYSVVGGGGGAIAYDSNSAIGNYSTVGGGNRNKSMDESATVSGGYYNTASGYMATVGGGAGNTASNMITTVGGGGDNTANGHSSTIGGGNSNTAIGGRATIGGGEHNDASSGFATVGGGFYNTASGLGALVGGGSFNGARGSYSVVSGGGGGNIADSNSAIGDYSCVPGGRANKAAGAYSFAAGRRAKALHDGSFVWGDATDADFSTTASNQFIIRASGGVGIGTTPTTNFDINGMARIRNLPVNTGTTVVTDGGGNLFRSASSRRYKDNILPLTINTVDVMKLQPVRFQYKDTHLEDIGLIAEDVDEVLKDLVIYDNEGKPDAVKYDRIAVYLLLVVKEQQKGIEELNARNEKLEARQAELEVLVKSLAEENSAKGGCALGTKSLGEIRTANDE